MRVSLVNLLIIGAALTLALVLTLIAVRIRRWRRDVALRRHAVPVLVMPFDDDSVTVPRPHGWPEVFPAGSAPSTVRRIPLDETQIVVRDDEDSDVVLVADKPRFPRDEQPLRAEVEYAVEGTGKIVEGDQVRFFRAEEGTLEFLPGRLEIVRGADIGQEIHFMRQVGEEEATITFGRSEGPALRHVQLLDPTVSRQHAQIAFSRGRWHLSNLSQTNPVALNGAPVPPSARALTLEEGDRIEMGAVVFVFHDR